MEPPPTLALRLERADLGVVPNGVFGIELGTNGVAGVELGTPGVAIGTPGAGVWPDPEGFGTAGMGPGWLLLPAGVEPL